MRKYKPVSFLISMTLLILLFQGSLESIQHDITKETSKNIINYLGSVTD